MAAEHRVRRAERLPLTFGQRYTMKPDPEPNTSQDSSELSAAQRNSLLGQQYFEEEELEVITRYERAVSLELHRHGGGSFSESLSNPMLLLGNGGLQSSSSAPISTSFVTSIQSAPKFPQYDSEHSSLNLENRGLQESSSRMDVNEYDSEIECLIHQRELQESSSENPEMRTDHGCSSQVPYASTKKGKRRAETIAKQREYYGGAIPDFVYVQRGPPRLYLEDIMEVIWADTPEEASRLETDPQWETVDKFTYEDIRRAHILDDNIDRAIPGSDESSLNTFDTTTGERKYPSRVYVDLPRRSPEDPHRTNGIANDELNRHRQLNRRRSQRKQNSLRKLRGRRNPFITTPPDITARAVQSSSSRPLHPSSSVRRSSADRRKQYSGKKYDPRRPPQQSRQKHRPWTRLSTPESFHHVHDLQGAHGQPIISPRTPPMLPPPIKIAGKGDPNLPYKKYDTRMIDKLSPAPRKIYGPFTKRFIVSSPQPAESKNEWYYKKEERLAQRQNQKRVPAPKHYPYPAAHIVPRPKIEERQAAAERRRAADPTRYQDHVEERLAAAAERLERYQNIAEQPTQQAKYSLAILISCSFTVFLLPFFATGRLDWVIRESTQGLIWGCKPEHRRMAWLIFLGELVAIFVITVIVVVAYKIKSS